MRRFFGVIGLALVVVLLGLGQGTSSRAGAMYDRLVDPLSQQCATGTTLYQTITDAVNAAVANDTIFVCAGTYTEPTLQVNDSGVSLLGPGSTPASDGVATIKLETDYDVSLNLGASEVTVSGLTFDATPNGPPQTQGIISQDVDTLTFTHNVVTGATSSSIFMTHPSGTGPYTISNNIVESTSIGIYCICPNAEIADNDISSPGNDFTGIDAQGTGITISGNTISGAKISFYGNNGVISNNSIDGTGEDINLIDVSGGGPIAITGNNLSNITQTAISLGENEIPIGATITKNTITNARYGIQFIDFQDNDFPVTALIGGSPANANVFIDSGDASGQSGELLTLTFGTANYNAEFNNWGLCTLDEIEEEIFHQPDDGVLGLVDFDPFIKPGGCPSGTPTPTATPSPTPSPSPSPSPTASPVGQSSWGDIDCLGGLAALDALKTMLGFLLLPYDHSQTCPDIGDVVGISSSLLWGDIDCSGIVDQLDALRILASLAETAFAPITNCPSVGDPITIAVS